MLPVSGSVSWVPKGGPIASAAIAFSVSWVPKTQPRPAAPAPRPPRHLKQFTPTPAARGREAKGEEGSDTVPTLTRPRAPRAPRGPLVFPFFWGEGGPARPLVAIFTKTLRTRHAPGAPTPRRNRAPTPRRPSVFWVPKTQPRPYAPAQPRNRATAPRAPHAPNGKKTAKPRQQKRGGDTLGGLMGAPEGGGRPIQLDPRDPSWTRFWGRIQAPIRMKNAPRIQRIQRIHAKTIPLPDLSKN